MSEISRLRVCVTGIVQGVSFRWFTRRAALEIGVTGWVRNLPDGRVELEAQGAGERIERLLGDLRQGPSASRVDDLSIETIPVRDDDEGFSIRT